MWIQCKSTERPDIKQNNNYTHKDFYKKGVLICVVQRGPLIHGGAWSQIGTFTFVSGSACSAEADANIPRGPCEPQKVKLVCELLIVVVGSKVKWKVRGNDLISRLCKNMDGKIGTLI